MRHLVDTHVAVWWLFDDRRLPRSHRRVLQQAEKTGASIGLSAMSLWEIAKLVERGRLTLSQSLDECLAQIESSSFFGILPLTARIAAESVRLGAAFPSDPADQIIAATARCHGLTLLTADERILGSGVVAVLE